MTIAMETWAGQLDTAKDGGVAVDWKIFIW